MAYQGRINFTDLDVERLNADLNPLGIDFVPLEDWKDLRGVDVLVGIRHYGKKRYKRKPASKLVNAWHAGIPFIGGWDSAYAQIGTPGTDYLRASSHKELVAHILELKEDAGLYNKLAGAGTERAKEFTAEAIAGKWAAMLEEKVVPVYRAWRQKPVASMASYKAKLLGYRVSSMLKSMARGTYRLAWIKRIRDLYYDPVG